MSKDEKFNEYTSNLVLGPTHKSRWIYSCSKQLLDRVIIAYSEKKKLTYNLFRPFNWIGPRLDSLEQAQLGNGRVITIFISNLVNNEPLVLVNGGKQKRSFTYLDDGIEALIKIITSENENTINRIFNIGNPSNSISIKEVADIMITEYEKLFPEKFTAGTVTKTQDDFYNKNYEDIIVRVPDISEARTLLDWVPSTNVTDSISLTLKKYLDDHFMNLTTR